MNRQNFSVSVKTQYAEEIHRAYLKCQHEGQLDFSLLNNILSRLMGYAATDGLSPKDFEDLVKAVIPGAWDRLEFVRKAA